MLSVDGDADAAVEARIRIGWNKFRQLVPLLTNKEVCVCVRARTRARVRACVCSVTTFQTSPLSNRHHLSYGDWLEV